MTEQDKQLIEFAKCTLDILWSREEWDSDTLADIASAAECFELGGTDSAGYFQSFVE